MEPSDGDLVLSARAGDREAFRALVERYQRKIAALALGMLRNRDDACVPSPLGGEDVRP